MLHGVRVAEGHGLLEQGPLLGRLLGGAAEGPLSEGGAASPGGGMAVALEEALEVTGHGVAGVTVMDVEHQARAADGHRAHG